MFGIAWSELLLIGIVALVVVPPKDLPAMMRTVGKWVGQMRRMAFDFQHQVNTALREAELDDIKKSVADLTTFDGIGDIRSGLESATRPLTMLEGQMREDLTIAPPTFTASGDVAPLEETHGLVDGAYRGPGEPESGEVTHQPEVTPVPSGTASEPTPPLDLAPAQSAAIEIVPVDVTTLPVHGSEPAPAHEPAITPRISGAAS